MRKRFNTFFIPRQLKKQVKMGRKHLFLPSLDYESYIEELVLYEPRLVTEVLIREGSAVLGEKGYLLLPKNEGIPCVFYCGLPVFKNKYRKEVKKILGK